MGNWLEKKAFKKINFPSNKLHISKKSLIKYLTIFKMSWQNTFVYRTSFIIRRLEMIILFLATFLFWYAVFNQNNHIAGYDKATMLTYIFGIAIMRGLIFSSRSNQVAPDIATGALSKYLIKPVKYFKWMFFLDLGDKTSELFFMILELIIILFIFNPSIIIQTNFLYLIGFIIIVLLSIFLYFYLSLLINLTTFWYPEHNGWPARFLFDVLMVFFTGGLLPLDMLPKSIYKFLILLPTAYLRFFPMQVYLGRINLKEYIVGLFIMVFWLYILIISVKKTWRKGLKIFYAAGL